MDLSLDPWTVFVMLFLFALLAVGIAWRIDRFRPTCKIRFDTKATSCHSTVNHDDKDY